MGNVFIEYFNDSSSCRATVAKSDPALDLPDLSHDWYGHIYPEAVQ